MSRANQCRFVATGDSLISRRLPEGDVASRDLACLIGEADFRFTNLETTVRYWDEGFPSAQSGGTWTSATPEMLEDLKSYRFNAMAWATNHTLDYSYGGLEATKRHLDRAGVLHAGAGMNLAEASAVRYLETRQGRVALISATSSFHESWIAGDSRPDVIGRPGINPLRFSTVYLVTAEQLKHLRDVAHDCVVNGKHEISVKGGFTLPDPEGVVRLGDKLFREAKEGETIGSVSRMSQKDWKRFQKGIDEAKRSADFVVVSIHAHEMKGRDNAQPADFLVEFARACIDQGADAVVGHGPHRVRGIEIYKNRPIFYSLGNFIFQNESVERLPTDFYEKYGLGPEHSVADAFKTRNGNDTKGLGVQPDIWESVVAEWEIRDGALHSITLHPISLGFDEPAYRRGWPRLSKDRNVLEDLQRLSRPFGTELCIENGVAVWRADR